MERVRVTDADLQSRVFARAREFAESGKIGVIVVVMHQDELRSVAGNFDRALLDTQDPAMKLLCADKFIGAVNALEKPR